MRRMVFQNLSKSGLLLLPDLVNTLVRYFAGLDGGEGFKIVYILFSNLKDQYARFTTFCIDNRDIIPASANDKVNKNLQFSRFGFSRVCNRLKINFDISATNNEMELVGAQIPGRLDLRLTSAKSVICM